MVSGCEGLVLQQPSGAGGRCEVVKISRIGHTRLRGTYFRNRVLKHGSPGVRRRYRVDFAYPVKYSSYTKQSLPYMKSLRAKLDCRERSTIDGQVDYEAASALRASKITRRCC